MIPEIKKKTSISSTGHYMNSSGHIPLKNSSHPPCTVASIQPYGISPSLQSKSLLHNVPVVLSPKTVNRIDRTQVGTCYEPFYPQLYPAVTSNPTLLQEAQTLPPAVGYPLDMSSPVGYQNGLVRHPNITIEHSSSENLLVQKNKPLTAYPPTKVFYNNSGPAQNQTLAINSERQKIEDEILLCQRELDSCWQEDEFDCPRVRVLNFILHKFIYIKLIKLFYLKPNHEKNHENLTCK